MASWEILTLENSKEWSELVNDCYQSDIHFTPQYLKIFERNSNLMLTGKAILFVKYNDDKSNYIAYPFFQRKINDEGMFSFIKKPLYDITSPWYFGGLLIYSTKNQKELLKQFVEEFHRFATNQYIITEFIRIHPFLDVNKEFLQLEPADYKYDITYLDLKGPLENIWSSFKKSNRNAINASLRKGVEIKFSNTEESLKIFFRLYNKTMKRVKAEEKYFFSLDFFKDLLVSLRNNIIIATAWFDGNPICSSIILFKSEIAHYWLSGLDIQYKALFPNNLLLLESIKWLKDKRCSIFCLMGGSNESLRKFKESFSKTQTPHFTANKVHDDVTYLYLNNIRKKVKKIHNATFFPSYRA